jgi:hypothetical protein
MRPDLCSPRFRGSGRRQCLDRAQDAARDGLPPGNVARAVRRVGAQRTRPGSKSRIRSSRPSWRCAWCIPSRHGSPIARLRFNPSRWLIAAQYEQQPGNYLAFFSSFDYLERAAEAFASISVHAPEARRYRRRQVPKCCGRTSRARPNGRFSEPGARPARFKRPASSIPTSSSIRPAEVISDAAKRTPGETPAKIIVD